MAVSNEPASHGTLTAGQPEPISAAPAEPVSADPADPAQPGTQLPPGLQEDRRRPGRLNTDNPHLIGIMRGQTPADAINLPLPADDTPPRGSLRPMIIAGLLFWAAALLLGRGF